MAQGKNSTSIWEIRGNIVGPEGGRILVERTVESLKDMWR